MNPNIVHELEAAKRRGLSAFGIVGWESAAGAANVSAPAREGVSLEVP